MTGIHLTRRLVLEECERIPDGSGGFQANWKPLGTLWADMRAGSGREQFVGGRPVSRTKYRIHVRAAPVGAPSRPLPDQRFREGERVFNILSVSEADPQARYLEIHAEEGVEP